MEKARGSLVQNSRETAEDDDDDEGDWGLTPNGAKIRNVWEV
jgi:hypothetical protein